jgi:hypothetical protein
MMITRFAATCVSISRIYRKKRESSHYKGTKLRIYKSVFVYVRE